jgi:hypothetical protein
MATPRVVPWSSTRTSARPCSPRLRRRGVGAAGLPREVGSTSVVNFYDIGAAPRRGSTLAVVARPGHPSSSPSSVLPVRAQFLALRFFLDLWCFLALWCVAGGADERGRPEPTCTSTVLL